MLFRVSSWVVLPFFLLECPLRRIEILYMEFFETILETLPQWAWIGALLARGSVGLLFALSGGGKLFIPARGEKMRETMRATGVPLPNVTAVAISLVEFVFGSLLVLGFLTPLCCLMLVGVMIGALTTVVVPGIKANSLLSWLSEFFYLPEVLYLVLLVWLFFAGPGWVSIDHLLFAE